FGASAVLVIVQLIATVAIGATNVTERCSSSRSTASPPIVHVSSPCTQPAGTSDSASTYVVPGTSRENATTGSAASTVPTAGSSVEPCSVNVNSNSQAASSAIAPSTVLVTVSDPGSAVLTTVHTADSPSARVTLCPSRMPTSHTKVPL